MANCERCKEKITLSNLYIFHDTETGETKKYCLACGEIEEKRNLMKQKEKEETNGKKITEKRIQNIEEISEPDSDLLIMKDIDTEVIENHEINETITDIFPRDNVAERINSYLDSEPLNTEKDNHYYIRIVGNHLEIGRVKVTLVE